MSMTLARDRLLQLFNFFKAVEERRTPPITDVQDHKWTLWLDALPVHEKCRLTRPCPDDGEWLSVTKPELTACPSPPAALDGWLVNGWDSPQLEHPTVHSERLASVGEEDKPETFEASEARTQSFQDWKGRRAVWRTREIPARAVDQLWSRLFSLHNDLQREGESLELMLGDGIFSYVDG